MSSRGLLVLAAVTFGALLAAPAQAQDYPVETGPMSASGGDLEPGDSTTLSGSGFAPGTDVDVLVESAPTHLDTVQADGAGAFTATVMIPAGLSAGEHTLIATGAAPGGGTLVLGYPFVVGGDDSGAGELPETGYPIGLLATAGGTVLLGGLGAIAYGVRRRLRAAAPASAGDGR